MIPPAGGGGGGDDADGTGGGDDPSPADAVVGPLTDVLEKLSIAIDPINTSHKLKGMLYKPEYHVQHVKNRVQLKQIDHSKLSYSELVYGWFCIIQQLQKLDGDVNSYIAHCKYVSSQAMLSQFTDNAFVGYDQHVMSQVIEEKTDTFVIGDALGVASHFHADNVIQKKPNVTPKTGKQGGAFRWNKRQSIDRSSDLLDKPASVSPVSRGDLLFIQLQELYRQV